MNNLSRYTLQAVLYGAFIAFVGYFSTSPPYTHLAPGEALVKLSFIHGAQPKRPCRQRTPEELAQLSPNMRAPMDCPRERANVVVELEIDGQHALHLVLAPSGLAKDGPAAVYRRLPVRAGSHRIIARLSDQASGKFNFERAQSFNLRPGRIMVIDFIPAEGGFVFKG